MSILTRFLIIFFGFVAAHGEAAEGVLVRVVGIDEGGVVTQTVTQIESQLRRLDGDVVIDSGSSVSTTHKKILITVGIRAWRQAIDTGGDTPLFSVLPPSALAELSSKRSNRPFAALLLEQPPSRFLNLALLLSAKGKVLGTLASPSLLERASRLEVQAQERGLRLHIEKVGKESEVGPAVDRLVQQVSMILALPDAIVHSAATVPPLLLISYRAGVPVIGFSESYLRAGAAVALYSNPEEIAQQMVEMVAAFRQGRVIPASQNLKYFSVGVNSSVSRSLGMSLPSSEELEAKLKQMKE